MIQILQSGRIFYRLLTLWLFSLLLQLHYSLFAYLLFRISFRFILIFFYPIISTKFEFLNHFSVLVIISKFLHLTYDFLVNIILSFINSYLTGCSVEYHCCPNIRNCSF